MKHARIRYQGRVHQVTVEDANAVRLADGTLLAEDRVEWLPPATGSMFALGLNYADHAAELSFKAPSEPLAFIKSPGTYTGHRQVSWRPDNVDYMHYECELVAVIGKPARNVRREDALGYLAGYTVCNDYAIRDYLENYYRPNLRVKNRDATTPVGPWIVDAAEVPTDPSGPPRAMYTAVAFLAGIFLAVAIVVVLDMLNTRVRNPEEAEELLGIPVIGRIPTIKG